MTAADSIRLVPMSDGAEIALRRFGPESAERFVVSHGNGLASDAFRDFIDCLAARYEVVAVDMRNHGHSPVGPPVARNWPRFVADLPAILAAVRTHFGDKPMHGAFHSLSAAVSLMTEAGSPMGWRSLTLFEPPVVPPSGSSIHQQFLDLHSELQQRAAKRRVHFDNIGRLAASIRKAPAYALLSPETADRLAAALLRPAPDGEGWMLRCPPAFEAETFKVWHVADAWDDIARVAVPVQVVAGDPDAHNAALLYRTARLMADQFGFAFHMMPGTTHHMQLEAPAPCADLAIAFATAHAA